MRNHDDNQVWLDQLLKDLGSEKKDVRNQAISEARRLFAEQLLILANAEAKQYRRGRWMLLGNSISLLLSLLLLVVVLIVVGLQAIPFFTMWCAFFSWIVIWTARRYSHLFFLHRSMIALIQARQDVRFVGHALLMLPHADKNLRFNLIGTLMGLLPKLQAEDVRAWPKDQKAALLHTLDHWEDVLHIPIASTPIRGPGLEGYNAELTICVLKALERVGDKAALEPVRQLANLSPVLIEANIQRGKDVPEEVERRYRQTGVSYLRGAAFWEDVKRVQQAAVECLEALEMRLESREQAQTLLRASGSTCIDPSGTLLRPAVGGSETASEELLRPIERLGG